jgi:hypothetical protein
MAGSPVHSPTAPPPFILSHFSASEETRKRKRESGLRGGARRGEGVVLSEGVLVLMQLAPPPRAARCILGETTASRASMTPSPTPAWTLPR